MHLKQYLMACFMLALLLETILEQSFSRIKYLDEVTVLIMGIVFLFFVIKERRVNKDELAILLLTVCMCGLGFAGNIARCLVRSRYLWCLDAFNMFKFIVAALGAARLFSSTKDNGYIIRYLTFFTEIVVALATAFLIVHLFKDINMTTDVRYGFRTYNFIFKRVGDFYEACLFILMIFFADLYVERRKITWVFIALTIVNMISTMRSRAFTYAALYIFFFIVFVILKEEKVKLRYAAPLVLAAAFIFAGQFSFYYANVTTRNMLLRYGIRIMLAYFPIGAGFGTFGTAVAQQHYSKLYLRYGFWRYYGGSMAYRNYLLDNYWPSIMAEIGFFGALCMLTVILLLFRRNIKMCRESYSRTCVYSCWTAMLLSSLVSSAFLAGTKAMIFAALAACLSPLAEENTVPDFGISAAVIKRLSFIKTMSRAKKRLLILAALILFGFAALGIRNRDRIRKKFFPETIKYETAIISGGEPLIYDGSADFTPYTDDLILKNARLRDESMRDVSVSFLRKALGDRYASLTDEEIWAVTGEYVSDGRTKTEVIREIGDKTADLSVFEVHLSDEDRMQILSNSKALNTPFDLKGPILEDVISVWLSAEKTGNFRKRYLYYSYTTYSGTKAQRKRMFSYTGYHLPSITLPESVPDLPADLLNSSVSTQKERTNKNISIANYVGITCNDGFGGNGNRDLSVYRTMDRLRSQHVTLMFRHKAPFGMPVYRTIDARIIGPEITLTRNSVTVEKDSAFDPYAYIASVLEKDGRNARHLLQVDNPVRTDIPGFYTVRYSCGASSKIKLAVKVTGSKKT